MPLNPTYRNFLNFAESCVLSCFSNVHNIKNISVPFLNYKPLKLLLRMFLATTTVAMVTYCVRKMTMCSAMVGEFFIPCLLHLVIRSGFTDQSIYECWKPSHLKQYALLHLGARHTRRYSVTLKISKLVKLFRSPQN